MDKDVKTKLEDDLIPTTDEEKVNKILAALDKCKGHIGDTATALGVERTTLWRWRKKDPVLNMMIDELSVDIVRDRLIDIINGKAEANTTSAVLFYLKCRGKKQGWSEKADFLDEKDESLTIDEIMKLKQDETMRRVVTNAKKRFKAIMKKAGTYSPKLNPQIDQMAEFHAYVMMLKRVVDSKGHKPVIMERSREGNKRMEKNKYESMYEEAFSKYCSGLRALGLNFDTKGVNPEDNSASDFFEELNRDREQE